MSSLKKTNDDNAPRQLDNIIITSTTGNLPQRRGNFQTKSVVREESELNLFLSDESSGTIDSTSSNDNEREMNGTSGETSNGSSSSNKTCSKKSISSVSTTEAWFREFNQNTKELNKNNLNNFDDGKFTNQFESNE